MPPLNCKNPQTPHDCYSENPYFQQIPASMNLTIYLTYQLDKFHTVIEIM